MRAICWATATARTDGSAMAGDPDHDFAMMMVMHHKMAVDTGRRLH